MSVAIKRTSYKSISLSNSLQLDERLSSASATCVSAQSSPVALGSFNGLPITFFFSVKVLLPFLSQSALYLLPSLCISLESPAGHEREQRKYHSKVMAGNLLCTRPSALFSHKTECQFFPPLLPLPVSHICLFSQTAT